MSTVLFQWAGHYYDPANNHDKVWAAAYTDDQTYLAVWGRRGGKLSSQAKPKLGQREFERKKAEKIAEGYRPIPFDDPRYNVKSFDLHYTPTGLPLNLEYQLAKPAHLDLAAAAQLFQSTGWGLAELVTGQHYLVTHDSKDGWAAYTDDGDPLETFPLDGFTHIASPFVIEGWLTADARAVVVDVLSWNGYDIRDLDYETRLHILEAGMQQAGLIQAAQPFSDRAAAISLLAATAPGSDWQTMLTVARADSRAGIVARALNASYPEGDTYYIQELKFKR